MKMASRDPKPAQKRYPKKWHVLVHQHIKVPPTREFISYLTIPDW